MAGPRGSRYYNVFLRYQIWLETLEGDRIVHAEAFDLLHHVRMKGSLMSAARSLDISYRKAWGVIRKAEESLGFELIERHRGGKQGGSSDLTPDGGNLLDAYQELQAEFDAATKQITKKFFRKLNE